jgi:hypothetical protein
MHESSPIGVASSDYYTENLEISDLKLVEDASLRRGTKQKKKASRVLGGDASLPELGPGLPHRWKRDMQCNAIQCTVESFLLKDNTTVFRVETEDEGDTLA